MKKSIFLLAIICSLAFVSATQKSFAWGEELSPWKVIPLDSNCNIYTHIVPGFIDHSDWNYESYSYVNYPIYSSVNVYNDSTLIYTYYNVTPYDSSKYILKHDGYVVNLNLKTNDKNIVRLRDRNKSELLKNLDGSTHYYLSKNGRYFITTECYDAGNSNRLCYLEDGKEIKFPFSGFLCLIFTKSNHILYTHSFVALGFNGNFGSDNGYNYISEYDTTCSPKLSEVTFGGEFNAAGYHGTIEAKNVFYMDESPDGKYYAAFHTPDLSENSTYLVGCYGKRLEDISKTDTANMGIFRIYKADSIGENYTVAQFLFPHPTTTEDCPFTYEEAKDIIQNRMPFRFGQHHLYMQNVYGKDLNISDPKTLQYYCFSRNLDNISATDCAPNDTFYLGYPLERAFWCNDDKNVLIFGDSTNTVSVLETTNYTKVNEITLASSNGRVLSHWQVFPQYDMIVGYNDFDSDHDGSIEIFKISGIAGVNDEETITSVLYPNPATQSATLELNLPSSNEIDLDISDLAGRVLRTQNCGRLASGVNSIAINTSALSSGSYFVTARGNNYSKTFKLIINK